ncbi:hypothetical protein [Proteiniclasticum sp.]|uniref:hypothetical protein n=1 Tax=Proteiniclasticum sp. TaxID=2053595 RepID=UPI0028A23767|nr:hypothetical protein [Proteiniclasticum sp.]
MASESFNPLYLSFHHGEFLRYTFKGNQKDLMTEVQHAGGLAVLFAAVHPVMIKYHDFTGIAAYG